MKDKNPPKPTHGRKPKYPFSAMQVFDFFVLPRDKNQTRMKGKVGALRSAASKYARAHKMKFTTLLMPEGLKVWRTG